MQNYILNIKNYVILCNFPASIREIRGLGDSTNVESIRQINLFLQNKAKFTKCPNELNGIYNNGLRHFLKSEASQKQTQNKAKTKPNKANLQNAQNECKLN